MSSDIKVIRRCLIRQKAATPVNRKSSCRMSFVINILLYQAMNVNICYIFQGAHVSQVVKAALET